MKLMSKRSACPNSRTSRWEGCSAGIRWTAALKSPHKVEDHPGLGLGLEEGRVTEKLGQLVPAAGLRQVRRQVGQGVRGQGAGVAAVLRPAQVRQPLVAPPATDRVERAAPVGMG